MKTRLRLVVTSAAVALLLAGCSTSPEENTELVVFGGSVPVRYSTIEQLARDTSVIVLGTVTDSASEKISDLEVTRYEFQVYKSFGVEAPPSVGVYQTGNADWILDMPVPPHLEVGKDYLLFLVPMGLERDQVGPDAYGILGVGAWAVNGDTLTALDNPDHKIDYGTIPTQLVLPDLEAVLPLDLLAANR